MFKIFRLTTLLACFLIFAGGLAAADEPAPAVTLVKQGEVFVVDATIVFPVPINIAWEVLTDFDHMAEVLGELTSSRVVKRQGEVLLVRQEGHARYGPFSYSFSSEREITLDPKKLIFARQISGNAKRYASEIELSETPAGTNCRYHAEIVPDSAIARIFGGPFLTHEVEQHFSAMKAEMQRRKAP